MRKRTASRIYEDAEIHNLWMGDHHSGIHLFRGQVIENDAPGSGRSPDIEPLIDVAPGTVYRKVLHLDDCRTEGAQLAFVATEELEHDSTLLVTMNGHAVQRPPSTVACPDAHQYSKLTAGNKSWSRWYYVELPPEALKPGDNEITFEAADGRPGWQLSVADYRNFAIGMEGPADLPDSSSFSTDGGESWEEERGEYVVRLVLDRYREGGELVSTVVDSCSADGDVIKQCMKVGDIRIAWDAQVPAGTQLVFHTRTGTTPTVSTDYWSDWSPCESGQSLTDVRGRYVQWKASFHTENRGETPHLEGVQMEAEVEESGPQLDVRVLKSSNERILRSSINFRHEDYHHPSLVELRKKFELDAVVAGAQTEFEMIERLLKWAYLVPLGPCSTFPWNVLDWLVLERDETGQIRMNQYENSRRDRMCLYSNVALVAACLSMGLPARHVNIHSEGMTGHEIAEVWSNDYRKWVHLDATRDYYWYDKATRVPLNTHEIRQALVDRLDRPERWDRPYLFHQDLDALVKDLPIAFREGCHPESVEEGAFYIFKTFCHFRIVTRGDVFSRERPLPVSQGVEVWSWNNYLDWADERVPPLAHFTQHTNRYADMFETLNQVHYSLEGHEEPDVLNVSLETNTPNFECYLASVDKGPWTECASVFKWDVHLGMNSLQVRSRNSAGRDGIVSSLTLGRLS